MSFFGPQKTNKESVMKYLLTDECVTPKEMKEVKEYFYDIVQKPLGFWDLEIINALLECDRKDEIPLPNLFKCEYLLLRAKCEKFLTNMDLSLLNEIENLILNYKKETHVKNDISLIATDLLFIDLIKLIYFSNNTLLIELFFRHLPAPPSSIFGPNMLVPRCIIEKENQTNTIIEKFLKTNVNQKYSELLQKITIIQRRFRRNKRKKEEQKRIPEYFKNVKMCYNLPQQYKPYQPQCAKDLSNRIISVSQKLHFFKGIMHQTRSNALRSIFDHGLFGRKTLNKFLMPFQPAALRKQDIKNGDGNVICFTANYGMIDPLAAAEVEIHFDFKKEDFRKNHCAFFKQFDFGFDGVVNEIEMGNGWKIIFSPGAEMPPDAPFNFTTVGIGYEPVSNPCWDLKYNRFPKISNIPNFEMISYDIEHIDQVLILNFFRLLDNLKDRDGLRVTEIDRIYAGIQQMSDSQLEKFLAQLGQQTSSSMEFNFFGAHLFNFERLLSIRCLKSGDTLQVKNLILAFQNEDLEMLSYAKQKFPGIFQSYRFLDFLRTKVSNTANTLIQKLYKETNPPAWLSINNPSQLIQTQPSHYSSKNKILTTNLSIAMKKKSKSKLKANVHSFEVEKAHPIKHLIKSNFLNKNTIKDLVSDLEKQSSQVLFRQFSNAIALHRVEEAENILKKHPALLYCHNSINYRFINYMVSTNNNKLISILINQHHMLDMFVKLEDVENIKYFVWYYQHIILKSPEEFAIFSVLESDNLEAVKFLISNTSINIHIKFNNISLLWSVLIKMSQAFEKNGFQKIPKEYLDIIALLVKKGVNVNEYYGNYAPITFIEERFQSCPLVNLLKSYFNKDPMEELTNQLESFLLKEVDSNFNDIIKDMHEICNGFDSLSLSDSANKIDPCIKELKKILRRFSFK